MLKRGRNMSIWRKRNLQAFVLIFNNASVVCNLTIEDDISLIVSFYLKHTRETHYIS